MAAFEHATVFWLVPVMLIVLFLILRAEFVKLTGERWSAYQRSKVRRRFIVLVLRWLAVIGLIAALAQPVVLRQEVKSGNPVLTILLDESDSFSLFDGGVGSDIKDTLLPEIPVRIRETGGGNVSALGDALLANMIGDDSLLLISDGRVTEGRSLGDVMVVASSINSTVSSLYLEPLRSDLSVRIEGPRVTTTGIDNEFLVRVVETSPALSEPLRYRVTVSVDDEVVVDQSSSGTDGFRFTRGFPEGMHRLAAEVFPEGGDFFSSNNVFYKSVKVERKPKVLLVSPEKSLMEKIFASLYDLNVVSSLSSADLSGYSAVVLNDVPERSVDVELLSDFIDDGNGLVVFGGRSSYEMGGYSGTLLESLLPVTVGTGDEGAKKFVNVVLLIDISDSTGSSFSTGSQASVEDVEKALALGIVETLRPDDRVGVVAFNVEPHVVVELERLSSNSGRISREIPRLVYRDSTLIAEGLRGAREMLLDADGSKNIILLSDGYSGSSGEDLEQARFAGERGIKVYSVGVGENTNSEHLKAIAEKGRGVYFEPSEAEKLGIIFGREEEAPQDKMRLEKLNSNHFITKGVKLKARLSGFNQVVPKPSADNLVVTAENRPVLSVWRFGLGRIAAFSTDDGRGWAAELLNRENSVLITRTVNWAIGDLGRKKEFDVDVPDSFLGEDFEIEVVADSMPSDPMLSFSKVGERTYSASFTPERQGWYSFVNSDGLSAANYPFELLNLGLDHDLAVLIQLTGGETFTPDQTGELLKKVKADSKKLVTSQDRLSWIPLVFAISMFLAEIFIRRFWENSDTRG